MRTDHARGPLAYTLGLLLLPLAALVTLVAADASGVSGGLALAGLVLVTERLVALRGSPVADRVLVGVGALLVAIVLTGVAMDLVGISLRPTSWIVAVAGLTVIGVGVAAIMPARRGTARSVDRAGIAVALRALPWVALVGVVVVVAVRTSATSLSHSDQPPLQMSVGKESAAGVQIVVTSTDPVGPLEVRTSVRGDQLSYPLISLGRDGTSTTTVTLPRTGRFLISLSYPDQTQPLRTLVVDRRRP